jgi:WD40 repeat protein
VPSWLSLEFSGKGGGMTQAISCVASHGVSGVMFSPDGQRIAIMSSGYTLQLFDIESGAALWKHRGADVDIDVDFSADGARLSVGGGADKVRILDADDGRVMLRRRNPMGGPGTRLTAISPDGTRLAATYSSYVWVYDVISRAEMQSFRLDEICQILRYSPDGTRIVTLAEGGIQVWDAASGHLQSTLRAPANTNSMEFGGCSHVLVTAGEDSIIRVWDIASGTKTKQLDPGPFIDWLRLGDGCGRVALTVTGMLRVWDVMTGHERILMDTPQPLRIAAVNSDGTKLATCSRRKSVQIWSIAATPALATADAAPDRWCLRCGDG